jgi:hypothetical protein
MSVSVRESVTESVGDLGHGSQIGIKKTVVYLCFSNHFLADSISSKPTVSEPASLAK